MKYRTIKKNGSDPDLEALAWSRKKRKDKKVMRKAKKGDTGKFVIPKNNREEKKLPEKIIETFIPNEFEDYLVNDASFFNIQTEIEELVKAGGISPEKAEKELNEFKHYQHEIFKLKKEKNE